MSIQNRGLAWTAGEEEEEERKDLQLVVVGVVEEPRM